MIFYSNSESFDYSAGKHFVTMNQSVMGTSNSTFLVPSVHKYIIHSHSSSFNISITSCVDIIISGNHERTDSILKPNSVSVETGLSGNEKMKAKYVQIRKEREV